MIARKWHGIIPKAKKEAYMDYLSHTGFRDYQSTEGNLGIQVLSRDELDYTHLDLITFWDSIDSIKKFAGEQFERARYYPEDRNFLVRQEPFVKHFEVLKIAKNDLNFNLIEFFRTDTGHHLGNSSWTK